MKNGNYSVGIESLVKAARDVLSEEEINEIKEIYGKRIVQYRQNPISHYLASAYEVLLKDKNLGKAKFNNIIKREVEISTEGFLEEIITGSPIQTIRNFNDFLIEVGYIRKNETEIKPYGNGVKIKMTNGCPYQTFCYETENNPKLPKKCIFGTVFKYVLDKVPDGKEYVNLLRKMPRSHKCSILVVPKIEILSEVTKSKERGDTLNIL